MIYLKLFWEFLKIGLFAFGGAYGAIPIIQQSVLAQGWMDEAMFANIVAISESTPGPIMVNAATYIGKTQGGVLGSLAATLGVILPSFVIILLVTAIFKKLLKKKPMQATLRGIKPCVMGVILATGVYMALSSVLGSLRKLSFDWVALVILVVLIATMTVFQKKKKKEVSPIFLIAVAAVLGAILY